MRKRIAIIGANEQQNPLIVRAKEKGYETHVFAWQTGGEVGEETADFFYPISASDKEKILEKCEELDIVAIASIGSDIAAVSSAYVAEQLGLVGNSSMSVICATNKLLTRYMFNKCQIPQPKFVEINDSLPQELDRLQFPLVVKPSDRSGGRGLRLVSTRQQLYRAINNAREISFERKAIVEEYVEGQLYSCECISYEGKHSILAYTKRVPYVISGCICEKEHSQPANLSGSVTKRMSEYAEKILTSLGLRNGASSIEFIVNASKEIFIIEVTPSMYGDFIGTHLVQISTGLDYLGMVIDIATGKQPLFASAGIPQIVTVKFVYSQNDMCEDMNFPDVPSKPDGIRYGWHLIARPHMAFGGCPPLEVNVKKPFYTVDRFTVALNSEYAAFWYALRILQPSRVYLPYFISPTWIRILEESDIEPLFYHLDQDFLPLGVDDIENKEDLILLINYHGVCSSKIKEYCDKGHKIIIDNSMAFFEEPVMNESVFNIYSARKFFSVPDGGYLVGKSMQKMPLDRDISYKRARMLLCSLELGEEAAYKEKMANDQELAKNYKMMSLLTEKMLSGIDYEYEKMRRLENLQILQRRLDRFNKFPLGTECRAVPQFYPLLVEEDVRTILINKHIFSPLMWRNTLDAEFNDTVEQYYSKKMLYLPIAPIYSTTDMEQMADIVEAVLS